MPGSTPPDDGDDARGWSRLVFDATLGLTDVVEAMHANAAWWIPPFGAWARDGKTRGPIGFVYGTVRLATRLTGKGIDLALSRFAAARAAEAPGSGEDPMKRRREVIRAVVNGVVGDHLAASANPLAIPMEPRRDGRALPLEREALAAALPDAGPLPLLLVHGSCTDDLTWLRHGHDHGAALARDLGYTPVYVRYNTGLHVSANGALLSGLLEALLAAWPVPVERLAVLAHSMGGLVTRAACHHAAATGAAWPRALADAVFLGTPHHGAPLERGGAWIDAALGLSSHSAPLAALGRIRSAGVTDLRHGRILEADHAGRDRFAPGPVTPVPLPPGVRCFAAAATLLPEPGLADDVVGDGLVPVASALGRHPDPARDLGFPAERRAIARGVGHIDLLSDPGTYAQVRAWLGGGEPG